jgi:hypothetical protein
LFPEKRPQLFPAAVLVALVPAAVLAQTHERRSHAVRLVGAAWVLVGLCPRWEVTSLETVLSAYGPGYWMLLAGTLLLVVASVHQLRPGKDTTPPR